MHTLRNRSLWRRLGPGLRQPRHLLCSSQLSGEHHFRAQLPVVLSVRNGTKCCQGLGLPSSLVVEPCVARPQTKRPPKESASMGGMRTQHPNQGSVPQEEQKHGAARDESPPMTSASKESTASRATTQFLLRSVGSGARPAQFARSGESTYSRHACRRTDGERLGSDCSSQSVHRSPETLLPPASEAAFPLSCYLRSVARHVLNGWPHSSLITSVRQSHGRSTAYLSSASHPIEIGDSVNAVNVSTGFLRDAFLDPSLA